MKTSLTIFVGIILVFASLNMSTQQVVKDKEYQIIIPSGWTRTESVPQGFDVGFRKKLAEGQYATFYFHYEVMTPEAGEPPSDTSDMKLQWDSMVRNKFPDVRSVSTEVPKVNGRILVNGLYELTDDGTRVRRRYTYFLSGRTAFVVQCSIPPSQWSATMQDFNNMLSSLQPGGSAPEKETKSDDAAKTELRHNLPTLLGSFPSQWTCSLVDVAITPATSTTKRTLEIKLSFNRSDIGDIYKAAKLLFRMLKEDKTDADFNSLPVETKMAFPKCAEFIKYVGQVWGYAGGYVASNCRPPIECYRVSILDSKGNRIGSVSISREDGSAILNGNITVSDAKIIASMYVFE